MAMNNPNKLISQANEYGGNLRQEPIGNAGSIQAYGPEASYPFADVLRHQTNTPYAQFSSQKRPEMIRNTRVIYLKLREGANGPGAHEP